MNLRLLCKLLGIIAMLIGGTMVFSLPWAHPSLGQRVGLETDGTFEWQGFTALLCSIVVCVTVGGLLMWLGRNATVQLFRKEAMAVVGLSWILATLLGALPFRLSGTYRSPGVRIVDEGHSPQVFDFSGRVWKHWVVKKELSLSEYCGIQAILDSRGRGLSASELQENADKLREQVLIDGTTLEDKTGGSTGTASVLRELTDRDADWGHVLLFPGSPGPADRVERFRIRWIRMTFVDALFESQSGFSTTGATMLSDLEDPKLVPHAILFWRSSTHFLGGLGIIVLFVAILGQGSAGKALMRAEMPGPSKEGSQTRMQHTAWVFAAIYIALNVALTVILKMFGLTWFDALCHAFGTMATGGFSTYNASVGHFDKPGIEYVIVLFMILAGTNFTLLYLLLLRRRPKALLADVEWCTYMLIILGVTLLVMLFGLTHGDLASEKGQPLLGQIPDALRYGLFQVVAILTTTGYGTHDFDGWNSFGRGVLFLLMFVGGCAGSTGGGMKVIRHILFLKILRLEIEQAFHPTVVRPLRLGGRAVEDKDLRKNIMVYFGLILVIFVFSWMFLVTVEPDVTWGRADEHKLIDSASGIAATLNNIGPGLGTVGATQNYGHFSQPAKVVFTWLMMIGRLEVFVILVLFVPGFWRSR